MKLFENMMREEKIVHIEKLDKEMPEILSSEGILLADIWDWTDYWVPWLLKEVKGSETMEKDDYLEKNCDEVVPGALARQKAAQAWCFEKTKKKVMDEVLCEAFAKILEDTTSRPWLGNATTERLLEEIRVRCEVDGTLQYKTVGDE